MFQTSYFNDSYSDFKSALQSYDKNFNENLFVKAIEVAETSHKDQFRASGDPYIIHPYEVCKSLIELKLDTETVITGLLHDVIEDTKFSKLELKENFQIEFFIQIPILLSLHGIILIELLCKLKFLVTNLRMKRN